MTLFESTVVDGRSETDVVIEVFKDQQPNDIVRYDSLMATLAEATGGREWTRSQVQNIVNRAKSRFLVIYSRALEAVPNVGYRIIEAREHKTVALKHRRKSDAQLRRSLKLLQNVKRDELEPAALQAHDAQTMLSSSILNRVRAMEEEKAADDELIAAALHKNREVTQKTEEVLESVLDRLDRLEKGKKGA